MMKTSSVQSKQIHVISEAPNGFETLSCELCLLTSKFNFL